MKIQPLDAESFYELLTRTNSARPVLKSRLKRLLRIRAEPTEFEPSSATLDTMVRSFIEDSNEKPLATKMSRSRCNCFNRNNYDSSDDEVDDFGDAFLINSSTDTLDKLKGLVQCESKSERNLLADASKIVEKNKTCKKIDDLRQVLANGLVVMGYDSSICKSHWEKSPACPAGDYEYIDVILEGGKDRVIIDVDFRSEFEIARSTSGYKSILQSLPLIFVGGPDRLNQIISIVSEAAKQSLKRKGMHIPPWRKGEYTKAKWLSPHTRTTIHGTADVTVHVPNMKSDAKCRGLVHELAVGSIWKPPEIKPRSCARGRMVTGLACLLREMP